MIRIVLTIAALLAVLAMPAQAAEVIAGSLKISASWARATPKGAGVGGGYLTITNTDSAPDRLVGGTTAISKNVEVHEMKMDGGVMKMRMLDGGLAIKPGKTVTLKPGGLHLMFTGLKRQLKKGEHFTAMLEFEKAGKVEVDFTVESLGAKQGGGHEHSMPGMKMKH